MANVAVFWDVLCIVRMIEYREERSNVAVFRDVLYVVHMIDYYTPNCVFTREMT